MSHLTEWNFLYADFNSPGQVRFRTRQKNNFGLCPGTSGVIPAAGDGGLTWRGDSLGDQRNFRRDYYANDIHCPLTSPIKYVEMQDLMDPFSDGTVPMGYDSRESGSSGWPQYNNKFPDTTAYGAYFSAGPDHFAGNWQDGDGRGRRAYSPTNGTKSSGEMWLVVEFLGGIAKTDGYYLLEVP
jgi:hypothetical protein